MEERGRGAGDLLFYLTFRAVGAMAVWPSEGGLQEVSATLFSGSRKQRSHRCQHQSDPKGGHFGLDPSNISRGSLY